MIKNILTTVLIISGLATGVMADPSAARFAQVNYTGETDAFSGVDLTRSFTAADFAEKRAGFANADAFEKQKSYGAYYDTEPQAEVKRSWFSLAACKRNFQASLTAMFAGIGSLMQKAIQGLPFAFMRLKA